MTGKNATVRTARGTMLRRLRRRLRGLRRDSKGAVAVLVALLSPVLIGAAGLGAEVGYWYVKQQTAQNAVDVAAHAAAMQNLAGDDAAALRTITEYLVAQADVDLATTTVTINQPPQGGGYTGDANAVELVVTEAVPRLFSGIFLEGPVQITARAVATGEPGGTGCVLALNQTVQGAITVAGSTDLSLSNCDMISNSSASPAFTRQGGGSSASVGCIQTVGTAQAAGIDMDCDSAREHASAVADPFANVAEPSMTGACQSGNVGQNNQTTTVTPVENHSSGMKSMRFCNGLSLRGNTTLEPGLYLVEGGTFQINANGNISGDGVVFFLADDVDIKFNGTASVDFTAPSSGPYAGILFFGSRSATTISHRINGNFGSALNGAIYTPASHMDLLGNARTSSNSCTQLISDTITFTGNGALDINCAAPTGATVTITGSVRIVE